MGSGIATYLAGQTLKLVVSTLREDGTLPSVSAAKYHVLDASGAEIVADIIPVTTQGLTELTVTIPDSLNTLAPGEKRAFRSLVVTMTLDDGSVDCHTRDYVIEAETLLEVWNNTYQTYGDAVLVGMDIPDLDNWNTATKPQRIAALVASYRAIQELTFNELTPYDLTKISLAQFQALDPLFIKSIMRAQVIEANELLDNDEISKLRELGVMSKTVGESKMFFRSNCGIQSLVSRRTLKELHRWIDTESRIGRA